MRRRRRNSSWTWLTLVCIRLGLEALPGQPVVLHLRNGDRVSGQVLAEEPGQITISNAVLGRLVLPLAQIERHEKLTNQVVAAPSPATPPPGASAAAPSLSPSLQRPLNDLRIAYLTGQLSAEEYHRQRARLLSQHAGVRPETPPPGGPGSQPAGPSVAVPAQAAAAKPPPAPKHWSGEVFAGTDLAFSAKDRELYSGRLKLNYTKMPLRNNLDYQFTYGRTDGELSANRMDGLMKTDYDLTPRGYLYSLGGAGYDAIRKIDWRYELGPGSGYHMIKRTNLVLRIEGGFHYQVQNFEGDRQDEVFYNRLAQEFRWNPGSLFSFDERAEYLPELGDFQVYRLRVEANARYWLSSNLSLNFTIINLYDTVTAPGVGQNDLQLRSSIGLKF